MVTRIVKLGDIKHKCGLPWNGRAGDIRVCSECGNYYKARRPILPPPGTVGYMCPAPERVIWDKLTIIGIWWHVTRKRRNGRT